LIIKKDSGYTKMVVQKSNIGHLKEIIRYKPLKLLRSYLSSKGQERIHARYCSDQEQGSSCAGMFKHSMGLGTE
jgi:hypothetical protein